MYGTLRKWNQERGFGFIELESQAIYNRVFVHISAFGSRIQPAIGSLVRFDVLENARGVQAINAQVVMEDPGNTNVMSASTVTNPTGASLLSLESSK
jgi:cold shock CspA family protein